MVAEQSSTAVTETSGAGMGRLRVTTADGRIVYVGGFPSMIEASAWGRALKRCKKLVQRVEVQRKDCGGWRPGLPLHTLAWWAGVAGLVLASLGVVPASAQPMTPEALQAADEARLSEVCKERLKSGCPEGIKLIVLPLGHPSLRGSIGFAQGTGANRRILIAAVLYGPLPAEHLRQVALGHEFAHHILAHTSGVCGSAIVKCEIAANRSAARILPWLWPDQYTEAQAIQAVQSVLGFYADGRAGTSASHPNTCQELRAFEEHYRLQPLEPDPCAAAREAAK